MVGVTSNSLETEVRETDVMGEDGVGNIALTVAVGELSMTVSVIGVVGNTEVSPELVAVVVAVASEL